MKTKEIFIRKLASIILCYNTESDKALRYYLKGKLNGTLDTLKEFGIFVALECTSTEITSFAIYESSD